MARGIPTAPCLAPQGDRKMPDEPPHTVESLLERTRAAAHSGCFFCGREHPSGLKLEFHELENGSVTARFPCDHLFEGYREALHGGAVAALLDSAMTNCLFSKGVVAVTAELVVRFLSPVRLDRPGEVTAAVTKVRGPLFYMQAEFRQGRSLAARARATFMGKDRAARVRHPGRSASVPIPKGSQRRQT
jgi:uncharacterized protein (TIGR00369 family)